MTGGLHASVSALLGARALGGRMIGVFVNTGLLQEGEEEAFERFFSGRIHLPLTFLDESGRFLQALKGIRDQDEKRCAVHSLLSVITREIQRQVPDLSLIIQDRTFADQPHEDYLKLRPGVSLLEPLHDLFLDEVRQVGSYLGLPYDMIAGQIIPDTGLSLNIIGEVTEEKLSVLRQADAIYREIIRQSGQSKKLSEYYAVLRPYEKNTYSVILRALGFHQGDCIRAARAPYDVLEESAERIRGECPQVMRVLYDLTPTRRQ
jgi:GMP synthase (glutamine-hydrolysing)